MFKTREDPLGQMRGWFRGEMKRVEMAVGSREVLAHTIQGTSGWKLMIKPSDRFRT